MTDCGICYEELDDTNIAIFPCHANHKMHLTCYNKCVIAGHGHCPFCRQYVDMSKQKKDLLKRIKKYNFLIKIITTVLVSIITYSILTIGILYLKKYDIKVDCANLIHESYMELSNTFLNGKCCANNLDINTYADCEILSNNVSKIVDIYLPTIEKLCKYNNYNQLEVLINYIHKGMSNYVRILERL